jgi:NAD(P)-dependent dehydrogenase (short-subunit alcohol dehydrogenase family)
MTAEVRGVEVRGAEARGGVGRLAGRIAVVTGAGSGIGLATTRRLAAEGAHVVAVDLDADAAAAAAGEVGGEPVRCDVGVEAEVAALFAGIDERHGRLDIAFNNAGISPPDDDSILTTDLAAWDRVLRVNTTSVSLSAGTRSRSC